MSQIKQLQPKPGLTLLAVKSDSTNNHTEFFVCHNELWSRHKITGEVDLEGFLPEGNWQILRKATDIPEEVWQGIVESRWDYYKNYLAPEDGNVGNYKRLVCSTATESAMSLLASHEVYSVNPYGEKPAETFNHPDWEYTRPKWQQAEANTGQWVILKRV